MQYRIPKTITTMNPCVEVLSKMWLSAMRKLIPHNKKDTEEEEILIAKFQLDNEIIVMKNRRDEFEKKKDSLTNDARNALMRKDQRAAKTMLTRRRRINAQLEQIYGAIVSLESTLDNYDCAQTTTTMLNAFKNSSHTISMWHGKNNGYSVEDADAIRQEFDEQMQISNEMTQIVSQPNHTQGFDQEINDMSLDDLMLELDNDIPQMPEGTGGNLLTTPTVITKMFANKGNAMPKITEECTEETQETELLIA